MTYCSCNCYQCHNPGDVHCGGTLCIHHVSTCPETLAAAWLEGARAAANGERHDGCAFQAPSLKRLFWFKGWHQATKAMTDARYMLEAAKQQ